MTQQLRESLSAIMDGEGNELELRRVLKTLEDYPEQADIWRRYHLMRSAMCRERGVVVDIDIAANVMMAIRQEETASDPAADDAVVAPVRLRKHRSLSLMGGAAVAAAVSLMVVTGVQFYRGHDQAGLPDAGTLQANNAALDSAAQQLASGGGESVSRTGTSYQGSSAVPASYADFSHAAADGSMMPVSWDISAQKKPYLRRYSEQATQYDGRNSARFRFEHGLRP